MTGYYQLLGSIVLIGLGGLFAAIDAAISTVSPARVDELVRDQRPGAGSLRKVMADRPRYVNLVVLLRTSCEITATALLVVFIRYHFSMVWGLYLAAGIMVLASFVVVGVGGGRETTVARVMRPAVFVPDSKPLDALLREMQRDRNHMALLVDEYGAIAGLVSIEDVLEEIVGEIADEYDQAETAPVEDLGDKRFRVSARLPIEDVGELYGVEFDDDLDVDTVGGLLALELGRVPLPGAEVISHGLRLHAEGGTDHRGRVRIGTVLLSPAEPDGADDEEADHPG